MLTQLSYQHAKKCRQADSGTDRQTAFQLYIVDFYPSIRMSVRTWNDTTFVLINHMPPLHAYFQMESNFWLCFMLD